MSNKQIEDLVELVFDTDMEEVMKEKSTLEYIHKLQQENKQLKEELDNIKDFNNKLQASKDRLDKDDYNLAHILTELEEWLKEHIEICKHNANIITEGSIEKKRLNYRAIIYDDTLDKIQELKEKYK